MWEFEHSLDADVTPEQVWARYADHATWPEWHAGIAQIHIDGPFAAGSTGTMTPVGQDTVPVTLTEVTVNESFSDETPVGDTAVLRFVHRLAALPGGGTRITHRVEIDGPAADQVGPQLGPQIAKGIPTIVESLAKAAQAG
ncbi:SRPBCC family protein [Streptomyces hoynatensis]|uniref:Polyketide cyclase n=1 Tax=Streptomyces hoynatensis TaxID=1141874 RepID=A0A3A9YRQ1_9ACTN|nr:SRPBCC family protein [Streptomyces hoynatensis]RKN38615.1 polyketide cyclase [Streptomyces hoynatensis]